jgi:hypothetical protein
MFGLTTPRHARSEPAGGDLTTKRLSRARPIHGFMWPPVGRKIPDCARRFPDRRADIKKDVLDAWNEVLPSGQRRGPAALRELPAKEFIEAASRICPKELFMAVQAAEPSPFEHLTPDQKRELAAMLTAKVIDGEHLSSTQVVSEKDE